MTASDTSSPTDVALRPNAPLAAAGDTATVEAGPLMSKIIELASSPSINPEMFDKLVAWQEREQARQAESAFNFAMNAAQNEIQPVARTAENKQTNSFFAKLEDVDAAIRPIYLKHGFALSYNTVTPLVAGNIRVECRCAHAAGHSERFYREAPADTLGPKGTAVKTLLHGGGSTETFLKRYLACGVFNVVFKNQDDDGVRGGMAYIKHEQIEELEALITSSGADRALFLQRFCDVHAIEEIEVKNFIGAKNELIAYKARRLQEAEGRRS